MPLTSRGSRDLVRSLHALERDGDDEDSLLTFRALLLETLSDGGFDVEDASEEPERRFDWERRQAMVVHATDDDAHVYAIPVAEISDSLWDAITEVDGLDLQDADDLTDVQWAAAMRTLAAFAIGDDPESFHALRTEEGKSFFSDDSEVELPTRDEIRSLWGTLSNYRIGSRDEGLDGLDRWFSAAIAFRRTE